MKKITNLFKIKFIYKFQSKQVNEKVNILFQNFEL